MAQFARESSVCFERKKLHKQTTEISWENNTGQGVGCHHEAFKRRPCMYETFQ